MLQLKNTLMSRFLKMQCYSLQRETQGISTLDSIQSGFYFKNSIYYGDDTVIPSFSSRMSTVRERPY